MTSAVGRYDNAPAHLIIISPRYSARSLNEIERKDIDHEAIALARAERVEAEYLKRQADNALRAEARKVQAALDKATKEERSKIEKQKFLARNQAKAETTKLEEARMAMARIRARKQTPEYKAKENARGRAKRAAEAATAPEGYATMIEAAQGSSMTVAGMRAAVIAGRLPGIKVGRIWYVNLSTAREYAAGKHERNVGRLAAICSAGGKAKCHTTK